MRVSFWYQCLIHSKQLISMTCSKILLKNDYFLIEDLHGKAFKYYLRKISSFEVKL